MSRVKQRKRGKILGSFHSLAMTSPDRLQKNKLEDDYPFPDMGLNFWYIFSVWEMGTNKVG